MFVIFDMDGLLIDSEPLWKGIEQQALDQVLGLRLSTHELKQYTGKATRDFVRSIAQSYPHLDVDQPALVNFIIERMASEITQAVMLPGALELIEYLESKSVPMAIASSTPRALIQAVVKAHQLPIELMTSGAEVPASKPHPEVFLRAAQIMNVDPSQCWVFEDSLNGVIAARAASMKVVAVPASDYDSMEHFSIAHRVDRSLLDSLEALKAGCF